jgi:hypothetical protein
LSSITICSAGTFKHLVNACQVLVAELQSALQQQQKQQKPASSVKGGFLSAGKRKQQSKKAPKQQQQQQQQRRPSDSILRGLTLGRVLITLWQALVQMPAGSSYHHTLFNNADQCASVLPASQLMLVLLRAQQQHTIQTSSGGSSGSSGSSSSSGATEWSWMVGSDEPAKQVQAALSAAATLAEAVAVGPREQESLQHLPGVMQLLATPDLHQLLITAVAWLTGQLHQQKQGMSAVPVEQVLRCLGNTSAAAAVTLDDDSSSSSSSDASAASPGSSSSSSSRVPLHHSKVLELLQASAADPLHGSGSEASQQPSSTLKALNASDAAPTSMADRLAAALLAAAFCLEIRRSSRGGWLIGGSGDDAVSYGAVQMAFVRPDSSRRSNSSSSSSSSRGSGEDARAWRQLAPAVARMLVSVVQMAPVGRVGCAAVTMLQSVVLRDASAVAESEAVVDILVDLGPAVMYAVLLQLQQQQQQGSGPTHKMHYLWAMLVMTVVSAASSADGE